MGATTVGETYLLQCRCAQTCLVIFIGSQISAKCMFFLRGMLNWTFVFSFMAESPLLGFIEGVGSSDNSRLVKNRNPMISYRYDFCIFLDDLGGLDGFHQWFLGCWPDVTEDRIAETTTWEWQRLCASWRSCVGLWQLILGTWVSMEPTRRYRCRGK